MVRTAASLTVLVDDWDNELDIEPQFVGRHKDIEMLKEAFTGRFRLFGVFGVKSVGKSRLVKELISRLFDDDFVVTGNNAPHNTPTVIRIDLCNQTNISSVHANLCASLGELPEKDAENEQRWILQIVNYLRRTRNRQFIFFFDNVENSEENDTFNEGLKSFFWHLAVKCMNVKTFITSTTKFMSARLKKVYFCHELLPLRPSDSAELFKAISPNVELGECEGPIIKLSEGLPLLISMIANELADDDGSITPQDMVKMLTTSRLKCLSRTDFYSEEDRIADIYKKFIERLIPFHRRRLGLLGYIPASFDAREAREILGYQDDYEVKDNALIPLRRRYMLTYDPQSRRYNIQGILRECLEVYFAIQNITEARKTYIKLFSSVMSKLCTKLGTEEYVKALSEFSHEQLNFQKLLREVYYTTEDTFQFFVTIATTCTEMIEQFMLKDCDKFYQGCLVMTERYGNSMDKAGVNLAVGSMWTNAKDNFRKGERHYREALKTLTTKGNRFQLATAYQRLGWNLHVQGQNVQALGYFQKSLNISQYGGPKFQRLMQQSLNSLGITNTMLGNYGDAEKYHFTALRRAKTTYNKDHPSIGAVLNNIGVFYNAKGDFDNAVKYYAEGLQIKRKNKAPQTSLTMSLSNVASVYSSVKKYDKAHELLDEGFKILDSQEMPSSQAVLAGLYDTKGKVLMAQERFSEAVDMFEKAADIREVIKPECITYVETLVHLAIAKKCVGLYKACEKTAKKALALKIKAKETMPQNSFIAECYECLADVYTKTGNEKKYSETLEHLESELCRLEELHICSCNDARVEKVRRQLKDIREKLHMNRNSATHTNTATLLYSRYENEHLL